MSKDQWGFYGIYGRRGHCKPEDEEWEALLRWEHCHSILVSGGVSSGRCC